MWSPCVRTLKALKAYKGLKWEKIKDFLTIISMFVGFQMQKIIAVFILVCFKTK